DARERPLEPAALADGAAGAPRAPGPPPRSPHERAHPVRQDAAGGRAPGAGSAAAPPVPGVSARGLGRRVLRAAGGVGARAGQGGAIDLLGRGASRADGDAAPSATGDRANPPASGPRGAPGSSRPRRSPLRSARLRL